MTTTESLPTIPNDVVLALLTDFNVRYSRKINISYQSWEFSHSQSVTFSPQHTPDEKRAIIRKISEFVRVSALQDIVATLPEIEQTCGDQYMVIETLKRSLGIQ